MKKFESVSVNENNEKYEELTSRETELYGRDGDVRDAFARDYTRILHCLAYRRLKHKTQVFFNIENDHICTRMEHVAHVESVSTTIADNLGLNPMLTKAISLGHDLGHAPFGHKGERIISELTARYLGETFWHEKNGLHFVDHIELLEDAQQKLKNLDLTYAVRDGIIAHCGEVDFASLKPRNEIFNLSEFDSPGKYESATWEGAVVKIADKIAYVGRDIEDAKRLGFLTKDDLRTLESFAGAFEQGAINTTVIIHGLVTDICRNSSPQDGLILSKEYASKLHEIKDFNYEKIYNNKRFKSFERFATLVIEELFQALFELYDGENTISNLIKFRINSNIRFVSDFLSWVIKYVESDILTLDGFAHIRTFYVNQKVFGRLDNKAVYVRAIIDYISGMTDSYAIRSFNELISY